MAMAAVLAAAALAARAASHAPPRWESPLAAATGAKSPALPGAASAALSAHGRCPDCDEAFRVVACLWGQMHLLRLVALLSRSRWTLQEWLSTTGSRASAMLLSCVMCVLAPGEATAFAAVSSSLANTLAMMPDEVDSAGPLELLVHANLLVGLAWALLTGRSAYEGWAACGPAVRSLTTVVLAFASLARLNREYRNVRRSACTALSLQLWDALLVRIGIERLPDVWGAGDRVLLLLLRGTTYIVEAAGIAMPILLWLGSVHVGLGLMWAHCVVLTLITAFDLPCLVVACMPFWVPPRHALALRWVTLTPLARCCSITLTLLLAPFSPPGASRMDHRHRIAALLWLIAACPLQYTATAGLSELGDPQCCCDLAQQEDGTIVQQVARATVGLALLNGMCPYLGLRTQATWTMFSNLCVEGGVTNHWIVPASWQIFGYTNECVTVTSTDVPALQVGWG
ncbi:unnamed protein product [Prorocentrum cordatum]|uniref:Uncharacterized protein n=1 Tax=Prorocentrum cordatum TaxID=2364126 RepID=A0ABN9TRX6_9DINO|nr:unnamed protein product [Polarella glacialis]